MGHAKSQVIILSKEPEDCRNTKMEEELTKVKDYFKVFEQFLKYKW